MPPAPPIFIGRTITAREEPQKWSAPLLALKPNGTHEFVRPPGTLALYLPPERIVSVEARALRDTAEWSSLICRGDFRRVERPQVEVLAPVAPDDAERLCHALAERYGLPRRPIEIDTATIATLPAHSYITTVGELREGHCEMPNFDGIVRVDGMTDILVTGRYRVTGFTSPGGGDAIGYRGASLTAITIEPD